MNEYFDALKLAVDYAKSHTNTRCAIMGECGDECPLGHKYCDFKSRRESFLQGCSTTIEKLKEKDRLKGKVPNTVQVHVTHRNGTLMLINMSRRLMNNDRAFASCLERAANREIGPEEIDIIRQEAIGI